MDPSSSKVTLKLLIDTTSNKVLFAEASKEVIDFLFNLLCLPLSTVIRLLNKNDMVGAIANLYQSVEDLGDTFMQPNLSKDVLLKPKIPLSEISGLLPANEDGGNTNTGTALYMCANRCGYYVTRVRETRCPSCGRTMDRAVSYMGDTATVDTVTIKSGFVKEVVTYMVMDDLVIQPMSTISSITLLNKFNVKEVGALQEKVVELDMTQGVNLLKASLQSKTVLTTVFLKNKTVL